MPDFISSPTVTPGQWISVGENRVLDAVVCVVRDSRSLCEVVYLDDRNRAINEDVAWTGQSWDFVQPGVRGGYADKYDRLREFVAILHRGRVGL